MISYSLLHFLVAHPGVVSLWWNCKPPGYTATSWPNAGPPNFVEHGSEFEREINKDKLIILLYICKVGKGCGQKLGGLQDKRVGYTTLMWHVFQPVFFADG